MIGPVAITVIASLRLSLGKEMFVKLAAISDVAFFKNSTI